MATRIDAARFEALIDENAVLARALGAAQQRSSTEAARPRLCDRLFDSERARTSELPPGGNGTTSVMALVG